MERKFMEPGFINRAAKKGDKEEETEFLSTMKFIDISLSITDFIPIRPI